MLTALMDKFKIKNLSNSFLGFKKTNKDSSLAYYLSLSRDTVAIADAEKKKQALEELISEISKLPENWDGYGALKISKPVIENVILIIKPITLFSKLLDPTITPLANGTISIEWETNQGIAYLEIGETRFSGYIKMNDQKPASIEGQANSLNIYNIYTLKCIHDLLFSFAVPRPLFCISSK